MKNKPMSWIIISLLLILVLFLGLKLSFNYLVFKTGKGEPNTQIPIGISLPITGDSIELIIKHQLPFVNLNGHLVIEGIMSNDIFYNGVFKNSIHIPKTDDGFTIILFKNGKRFVWGSQSGFEMKNKNNKVILFPAYSKKHLGWYKIK